MVAAPYNDSPNGPWKMSGVSVTIRPIEVADEARIGRFHQTLSTESVHERYFGLLTLRQRTGHDRLARICRPDPGEVVLVAEITAGAPGEGGAVGEIIAVARLAPLAGHRAAEMALIVSDAFQGRGLGTELFGRLIQAARQQRLERLHARVLSGNTAMLRLCAKMGMNIPMCSESGEVTAVLELEPNHLPAPGG